MYILAQCFPPNPNLTSSRLEQNISVIACSVPAFLQPLFKAFQQSNPGLFQYQRRPIQNHIRSYLRGKETTANKFSSRSRNFHSIKNNDTNSDSEEQILPSQHEAAADFGSPTEAGGNEIRKTTDVQLFYHDAGVTGKQAESAGQGQAH